jgi:excisionase family DNA binding protein
MSHLSIQEAANVLGVAPKTVRRYISQGIIPAERIGPRLIRIRQADLEAVGRRIPAAS